MSHSQRFAHTIGVDEQRGVVSIDGVDLPYIVAGDVYSPELVNFHNGQLWGVTLTLYADHVELVGRRGERQLRDSAWHHEADMEWARREARRIVLEGMADILEWSWTGLTKYLESYPARYVLGLDEAERQALLSETTHSDAGQEIGDTE